MATEEGDLKAKEALRAKAKAELATSEDAARKAAQEAGALDMAQVKKGKNNNDHQLVPWMAWG